MGTLKVTSIQKPLLRSVSAIVLGLLLVFSPLRSDIMYLIVGVIIGLPSLYTLLAYLIVPNRDEHLFPIIPTMALMFAFTLIVFPVWYLHITKYVLGGTAILVGVYQLLYLITRKRAIRRKADWMCYVFPLVLVLIGVGVVCNPFNWVLHTLVVFFGIAVLIYAYTNLLFYVRLQPDEPVVSEALTPIEDADAEVIDEDGKF